MVLKNVGINSTFEQQRVVINEIAVDIESVLTGTAGISSYANSSGISSDSNKLGNQLPSYYLDYANFTGKPINVSQFINDTGYITGSYFTDRGGINVSPAGVVTAFAFYGSGSTLTGVVTSLVAGNNITVSSSSGQVIVSSTASGDNNYWTINGSGISTTANLGVGTTLPSTKLEVVGQSTFDGNVEFKAGAYFGDGDILHFGNSQDLQIQHNGLTNIIDGSLKDLYINSHNTQVNVNGSETAARFLSNSAVELYYDNALKFTTSGVGVTVLGTVDAQYFVGDGSQLTNLPGGGGGGESYWVSTAAGIHTLSNVGIGSTIPTSKLTVQGDVSVSGVSTFNDDLRVSNVDSNLRLGLKSNQFSNQLELRHSDSGGSSHIYHTGSGSFYFSMEQGIGDKIQFDTISEVLCRMYRNGPVELYYDNVKTFETTSTGAIVTGILTATSFTGSGANLTSLPAGQLTGALPAIDGSALTGVTAIGSGVEIRDSGTAVGTASTIDFGANLSVSPVSAGVVTVTASGGGGGESYWTSEATGLSTTSSIGLSTTPFADVPAMSLPYGGQIVFDKKTNGTRHLVAIGDTTTANPTGRDLISSLAVGGVYIGNRAGQQITNPGGGILIGDGAGRLITDSTSNIVIGAEAGIGLTSSVYYNGKFSSSNVVIGSNCGGSKMGRYNLILGAGAGVGGGYPVSGGNMGEGCVVIGTFDFNSNGAPIVPLEYGSHQLVIGAGSTNWINGTEDYNVGFGTTNPTSKLTVEGDGKFTGVVTATRFESSSAGTPTIDSPNNLNINALNVGISTDLSVGRDLTVNGNVNAVGVVTATSFKTNSTVGDGTDVGFAIKYYITANGVSAYRFAGPGVVNTIDNPTLYLHRGFTYIFENSTTTSHPFAIRYTSGGTGYGSTYLSGPQTGTQIFTVPFDAPSSLVYQCTIHGGAMVGTLAIVS